MATLKDLARHVGVSVSAVSMALRDHPSIGAETKRKIWQAKEALGYQVKVKSGDSVAFLLFDRGFEQPVYARFFQSIGRMAIKHQMHPIYLSLESASFMTENLPPILRRKGVGGMIVSGVYGQSAHEKLSMLGIPLVALGIYSLGSKPWAACEVDIVGGLRLGIETLAQEGHRRIGLVASAPLEREYGRQIQRSFLDALEIHGLKSAGIIHEEISRNAPEDAIFQQAVTPLLKKPNRPTAIIIEKANSALYDACEALGLRIPQDVSVLSLGRTSHELRPSLATVESNPEEMGRGAFEKLLRMIADPKAEPTREIFPMSLIPGQSIGPCQE